MAHQTRLILVFILSAGLVCFNLASAPDSRAFAQPGAHLQAGPATEAKLPLPARIAQTVARLRQITVEEEDDEVPPAARPLLTRLKHQLRDLILTSLNRPDVQVASLKSEILAELNGVGVTVAAPPKDEPIDTATEQESSSMPSPKPEAELPKPEAEPPKPEAEPPKPEAELPKPEAELPKPEAEPPKPEAVLPSPEVVLPTPGTGLIVMGSGSVNPSRAEEPAPETPKSPYVPQDYVYGEINGIDIQQPDDYPELVAATTTLCVCCCGDDTDTSLYLFQRFESQWRLILAQESNGYEAPDGAQQSFEYRISPPDPQGRFFVVTANVTPWCMSNGNAQSLRYQVMRPSGLPYRPQMILKESQTIYPVTDPAVLKLDAESDGISLEFEADKGLDLRIQTRTYLVKYRIKDDIPKRIPPLGEVPEDFLDEWLDLEWPEAAQWADAGAWPDLQPVHAALHAREGYHAAEILFVHPSADGNMWKIGLDVREDADERAKHPPEAQTPLPDQLFFTIEKRKGVFVVLSVSSETPPDCAQEPEQFGSGL